MPWHQITTMVQQLTNNFTAIEGRCHPGHTAGTAPGMGQTSQSGLLAPIHPRMPLNVLRISSTVPMAMNAWYVNFMPGVSANRIVGAK